MKLKQQVNNEVYRRLGHIWWDEEQGGALNLLRFVMNPVRTKYFLRMIEQARASGGTWQKVLDMGCGIGGPARALRRRVGPGGTVTGVDVVAEYCREFRFTLELQQEAAIDRDLATREGPCVRH